MAKRNVPHSKEAEEGVLGSVLLEKNGMNVIADILSPSSFYLRENQLIYEAFVFLKNEKKPIDLLTVRTYLDDRDLLEQAGGQQRLIALTETLFTSANLEQYAKTVRSKFLRRQLIAAGTSISDMGNDEDKNVEDLFEEVNNTTKKLSSLVPSKSHTSLIDNIATYQQTRKENFGKDLFGWSWGPNLSFLDKMTSGIVKQKMHRIGAMSGAGKTQLGAYNLIPNLLKQGAKVVFFTLENNISTTLNNILANMQQVNSKSLMRGDVDVDINILEPYENTLSIIDTTTDLHTIFKMIRDIKPDVILIDYVGLITIKGVPEEKKYAEYARLTQAFCKEEDLCWIDLSNLKMGNEDEPMKIVIAGHFYGATELKSNIDIGIHIINNKDFVAFREKIVEMDGEDGADKIPYKAVDVWITKNRGGNEMMRRTYVYQWNKGGRMREATKEERENWKNGFTMLNN